MNNRRTELLRILDEYIEHVNAGKKWQPSSWSFELAESRTPTLDREQREAREEVVLASLTMLETLATLGAPLDVLALIGETVIQLYLDALAAETAVSGRPEGEPPTGMYL